MIRPMRLHGAPALIAAGAAGDRALGLALSSPSATVATSMTRPAASLRHTQAQALARWDKRSL
jgi:hypothetical protein